MWGDTAGDPRAGKTHALAYVKDTCGVMDNGPSSIEEADRNARELIEEEEKEKEKADKKRQKKKRQKDRIRQQKLQESAKAQDGDPVPTSGTINNDYVATIPAVVTPDPACPRVSEVLTSATVNNDCVAVESAVVVDADAVSTDASDSGNEDDLDLGSSFVRKVQIKMENKPKRERKNRSKEPSRDKVLDRSQESVCDEQETCAKDQAPIPNNGSRVSQYNIQSSMDLANIGNNLASKGLFKESLSYFAEAIKLNPVEYRFLGNRSYSYERIGSFKEALQDAEKALELQPRFIKGHFRKGRALKGLKRYSEAVAAFQQVLLCDGNHVEAAAETTQCQQEMMKCTKEKTQKTSPMSLPATQSNSVGCNKVFVARNVSYTRADGKKSAPAPTLNLPLARPPPASTHSKLYPVWVGNVTDKITENILRSHFEPFGPIHSMRILYSRTCAFINYTSKDAAEFAFRTLQGLIIEGTTFVLQLRNPEHTNGNVGGM
ncbi:tetratricopeptide repeat protein 31 isoform X2 [Pseudophryne corroboree]|uniref:tetratricopeptide repeat protein 31 isoform X2 n=1 Tax=Pseudophryne corroboree TaxID=495146 RepID=UPI0030821066